MWQGQQTYSFDEFYSKLKSSHYPRLKAMNVDIGPALRDEVPEGGSGIDLLIFQPTNIIK